MRIVVCLGIAASIGLLSISFSGCPVVPEPEPGAARALLLFTAGDGSKQGGSITADDIERFDIAITEVHATTGEFDGEEETVFSGRAEVSLLDLNIISTVLSDAELPAGRYKKFRITMADPQLVLSSDPDTVITNVNLGENNALVISGTFDILRERTSVVRLALGGIALSTPAAGQYALVPNAAAAVTAGPVPALARGTIADLDWEAWELSVDLGEGSVESDFTSDTLVSLATNPVETYYNAGHEAAYLADGQPVSVRGTITSSGILHADVIRHEFELNEAAARDLLCRIVEAEYAYADENGGFAIDASLLEGLPDLTSMIDGYNFVLDGNETQFSVWATPTYGVTGANGYFVNQTRIIRYVTGADADALAPPFGDFCGANGVQITQNEASAREILCQVLEAQYVFYGEHGSFSSDFSELAGLPDLSIAVNGYHFVLGSGSFGSSEVISQIAINANAEVYGSTGFNGFYVDEHGDIRVEAGQDAHIDSSLFGEACISENGDIARNEVSAREMLCRIFIAEEAFFQAFGVYTTNATELSGLPDLSVPVEGYAFVLDGDPSNFTVNAKAVVYGETGLNGYFTDTSGVLRFEIAADATPDSPEFGQLCAYPPAKSNTPR